MNTLPPVRGTNERYDMTTTTTNNETIKHIKLEKKPVTSKLRNELKVPHRNYKNKISWIAK